MFSVPWRLIAATGDGLIVSWSGGTCNSKVPVRARLIVREQARLVRVGVFVSEIDANPCPGVATAGLSYHRLRRPLDARQLVPLRVTRREAPPPRLEHRA